MAFDQSTRNRLARFVSEARTLLTEEFTRQLQNDYGLDPARGAVTELARLTQLDDAGRETARILRDTLAHYLAGQPTLNAKAHQEALDRIVREQAFTVLNRLCALRMAEARELLIESVAKGYQSRGFQLYALLAGTALGETGDAYRAYLFSLFDEFGVDLAVLFDRFSPQGRLFPRPSTLLQLLDAINHPDIDPLWAEDETIGWIYQYFNSKEERKAMRDASQAPRNSRELAVRNQFFTPRYVVEFLTDNTLGRIWYEMTQGQTGLVDSCRYLVRRPAEIFLAEGEKGPEDRETGTQGDTELSQEELLRQPIYIPFRPMKDPRTILMLDPACGSMHFGLYAFDLYELIYDEAWELEGERGPKALQRPAVMAPLHERYADKESFLRDVPRLIIEHNIHGIDIDPRAVQIAGLSLWLRAQRGWQAQGVKPQERPVIRKSNIVCAEPMPGDRALLEEFLQGLRDDRLEALIRRVLNVPENQRVRATPTMADALCDLVRTVWEEMKLAGEAGSLLKIEEALTEAISKGRAEWEKMPLFRVETFRMTEEKPKVNYLKVIPGENVDFWARAEALVLAALEEYAGQVQNGGYQKRLFADDAVRGFAFIDLCRKFYSIVLMNPPFGESSKNSKAYLEMQFEAINDVYAVFVERWLERLDSGAALGAITSRTGMFLSSFKNWRKEILLSKAPPFVLADLGGGVLDSAMVETASYCLFKGYENKSMFIKLLNIEAKDTVLSKTLEAISCGNAPANVFSILVQEFQKIPNAPFCYDASKPVFDLFSTFPATQSNDIQVCEGLNTTDNERYLRLYWEVDSIQIGRNRYWIPLAKGGEYSEYFSDLHLLINWNCSGAELKALVKQLYGSETKRIYGQGYYFKSGITYSQRTQKGLSFRCFPADAIFNVKGPSVFSTQVSLPTLLGILNSSIYKALVELQTAFGSYNVGYS